MEQTAAAIGRSPEWTCRLRNRFLAGEIVGDGQRQRRGGRRRQNMTPERERQLLTPFLTGPAPAASWWSARSRRNWSGTGRRCLVVGVQPAAPARLEETGAGQASSASDEAAQREWKKNSPTSSPGSAPTGRKGRPSD